MNYFRAPVLLSLFLVFASVVQAIQSVTRQGRYLYAGNDRLALMGIAYQEQGHSYFHDLLFLKFNLTF